MRDALKIFNSIPIIAIQNKKGGKMPYNYSFFKLSVHLDDHVRCVSAIMMHTEFCFIWAL